MDKVLVVDDDIDILTVVSIILQGCGFEVEALVSAFNVEGKIEAFAPNIILLDVYISGYDGREICRSLQAETSFYKHIPVVLFSAAPHINHLECGACDFLKKPFDITQLEEIIKRNILAA